MVLVTGATGTVGQLLVTQLLESGVAVRALSRHPNRADLPDQVDVVDGDLTDAESLSVRDLTGVEPRPFSAWSVEYAPRFG